MLRTVAIAVALGLGSTWALVPATFGGDIPFEFLVKHPDGVEPEDIVEQGLKRDRQWVLQTLIDTVTSRGAPGRRLSALMQIELHGDSQWLDALTKAVPRIDRRTLATAAGHVATRMRGRLIANPALAVQYWTGLSRSRDPVEVLDAVGALGDLGDRRAIPSLLELSLDVRGDTSADQQEPADPDSSTPPRQLPAGLGQEIQLALQKIGLLSSRNPLDAFYAAASGEPHPDLRDRNGVCRLKIWGLRGLSSLKSTEAKRKLVELLERYDVRLRQLFATAKGDKRLAHQLFALDRSDAYVEEALRCATRAGQDLSASGRLRAVREVLRVP